MAILCAIFMQSKFHLGNLVITANANAQLDHQTVIKSLLRHGACDWGELCQEDARSNNDALKTGDRLLSIYRSGNHRFWIITEADRTLTTVLMPEDY